MFCYNVGIISCSTTDIPNSIQEPLTTGGGSIRDVHLQSQLAVISTEDLAGGTQLLTMFYQDTSNKVKTLKGSLGPNRTMGSWTPGPLIAEGAPGTRITVLSWQEARKGASVATISAVYYADQNSQVREYIYDGMWQLGEYENPSIHTAIFLLQRRRRMGRIPPAE